MLLCRQAFYRLNSFPAVDSPAEQRPRISMQQKGSSSCSTTWVKGLRAAQLVQRESRLGQIFGHRRPAFAGSIFLKAELR